MPATALKLPDFAAARRNMIESQLRPNMVRDERVLEVMETLPREMFVPESLMGVAYIDENLPVAAGRYLLSPMVLARMLESASIRPTDKVLEIASATGCSTAALARLAAQVVGVEASGALQGHAAAALSSLDIQNAEVRLAPMQKGWKTDAPYDLIFVAGAVDAIPDGLFLQLGDDGRLIVIERRYGAAHAAHSGEVRLYRKSGETVSYVSLFDANAALLPGFAAESAFRF